MSRRHSQVAWAAGLFEGEGCISWQPMRSQPGGKKYRYPVAVLVSTDEDVVRRFHRVVGLGNVGGPYGPYGHGNKPNWRWCAFNQDARRVLRVLQPWLCARRLARLKEVLHVAAAA